MKKKPAPTALDVSIGKLKKLIEVEQQEVLKRASRIAGMTTALGLMQDMKDDETDRALKQKLAPKPPHIVTTPER